MWNVNCRNYRRIVIFHFRINRNIVECKLRLPNYLIYLIAELIETLWNVNLTVKLTRAILCLGINRNIVECKYKLDPPHSATFSWINRNIVECKYVWKASLLSAVSRINRNIVECKWRKRIAKGWVLMELIETLWNVNIINLEYIYIVYFELIETLWNVNDCR